MENHQCLMGQFTIDGHVKNSEMLVYQRVTLGAGVFIPFISVKGRNCGVSSWISTVKLDCVTC